MTDTGATPPDPGGQAGAPRPEANPDPGGAGGPGQPSTFTQEQVAHLLAEEKRRAAAKFSDYDAVKQRLAEIEQAGQTELEKAQAKLQEAVAARDRAVADRNGLYVRSAITTAAARAGAVDPEVVVALLADRVTVADGAIEGDVNALVVQLLEDRPFLRANPSASRGAADGGVHGRTPAAPVTPTSRMDQVLRGSPASG
jgi:hypothetical protein